MRSGVLRTVSSGVSRKQSEQEVLRCPLCPSFKLWTLRVRVSRVRGLGKHHEDPTGHCSDVSVVPEDSKGVINSLAFPRKTYLQVETQVLAGTEAGKPALHGPFRFPVSKGHAHAGKGRQPSVSGRHTRCHDPNPFPATASREV